MGAKFILGVEGRVKQLKERLEEWFLREGVGSSYA